MSFRCQASPSRWLPYSPLWICCKSISAYLGVKHSKRGPTLFSVKFSPKASAYSSALISMFQASILFQQYYYVSIGKLVSSNLVKLVQHSLFPPNPYSTWPENTNRSISRRISIVTLAREYQYELRLRSTCMFKQGRTHFRDMTYIYDTNQRSNYKASILLQN